MTTKAKMDRLNFMRALVKSDQMLISKIARTVAKRLEEIAELEAEQEYWNKYYADQEALKELYRKAESEE